MDQFKIHQIKNPEDQYFAEFWMIYAVSFPLNERRTLEQQTAILNTTGYFLNIFISDNQLIGFICYWTMKEFIFIEHLAIAPELRNQGYGNAILKSFVKNNPSPIFLEIELPVDSITRSRLHFYESLYFKMNAHNHYQPAYHTGDEPIPMNILTYPTVINDSSYQKFARFQEEIVMGQFS